MSLLSRPMSTVLEAAKRRNPLPTGTLAVGAGLLVAGLSAYGFLVVANIPLSEAEYAPLSALWGLVFLAGPGLFLPLEQEVSRALSARRARGQGGAPVVRRAATIGVGLGLGVIVLLIATAQWSVDRLFDHQLLLLVGFVLGLSGALAGHLTRGCLSGTGRFKGYAAYIGADGFLRFLGAVLCVLVGVTTAGWFGVALGVAGLLAVPVALRVERPVLDEGPEAAFREVSSALGYLMAASLLSFGIMNISPVLVKLLAASDEVEAAGRFLPALVIARIPLFLFQAVQAALLPKLSALASAGALGDFRSGLKRLLAVVAALAAAGTIGGFTLAPSVVGILFPDAELGNRTLGLLAAGSGLYMLALACAQAVIALGGHRDQVIGWALGMATLLTTTLVASDDLFLRVELGLLVGSMVAFATMAFLLVRRLHVAGPLHIESGDVIEALHEVPIEP
jgi:O-antigen/teichoic acid export membrane protein